MISVATGSTRTCTHMTTATLLNWNQSLELAQTKSHVSFGSHDIYSIHNNTILTNIHVLIFL